MRASVRDYRSPCAQRTTTQEIAMKVKTNVRAGQGANSGGVNSGGVNGGHSSSTDSTSVQAPAPVVYYAPPISRCVGI
jgi:hypothetical protein